MYLRWFSKQVLAQGQSSCIHTITCMVNTVHAVWKCYRADRKVNRLANTPSVSATEHSAEAGPSGSTGNIVDSQHSFVSGTSWLRSNHFKQSLGRRFAHSRISQRQLMQSHCTPNISYQQHDKFCCSGARFFVDSHICEASEPHCPHWRYL